MSHFVERVTAAWQRDQQHAGRKAVAATDVPLSYEAITDDWLTAVLCAQHPGAAVVSHTLDAVDNGSSNRRKIYIEYKATSNPKKAPKDYIGKFDFDIDSFAGDLADTWKGRMQNLAMVVDLGPLTRLMTIKGSFNSQKGQEADYGGDSSGQNLPIPEIEFSDAVGRHSERHQPRLDPERNEVAVHALGQILDGRRIEVVVMIVREYQPFDRRQLFQRDRRRMEALRPDPLERRGAFAEHRIDQPVFAAQLEQVR